MLILTFTAPPLASLPIHFLLADIPAEEEREEEGEEAEFAKPDLEIDKELAEVKEKGGQGGVALPLPPPPSSSSSSFASSHRGCCSAFSPLPPPPSSSSSSSFLLPLFLLLLPQGMLLKLASRFPLNQGMAESAGAPDAHYTRNRCGQGALSSPSSTSRSSLYSSSSSPLCTMHLSNPWLSSATLLTIARANFHGPCTTFPFTHLAGYCCLPATLPADYTACLPHYISATLPAGYSACLPHCMLATPPTRQNFS